MKNEARILKSIRLFNLVMYMSKLATLDAICNVSHLNAEYLLFPSLKRTRICPTCRSEKNRDVLFLSINVDVIIKNGLGHLQEAINSMDCNDNYMCKTCQETEETHVQYGPHMIIDTSSLSHDSYVADLGVVSSDYPLSSVSKRINVNGKFYSIVSVANYLDTTQVLFIQGFHGLNTMILKKKESKWTIIMYHTPYDNLYVTIIIKFILLTDTYCCYYNSTTIKV